MIEFPFHRAPKGIQTNPIGHLKMPFMDKTRDICLIIGALVQAYGCSDAIARKICYFLFLQKLKILWPWNFLCACADMNPI